MWKHDIIIVVVHCISFEINIFLKKTFWRQDWKMKKAEEERPTSNRTAQKYSCLNDKAILAFHNSNEKKNAWEAVESWFRNWWSCKKCFHQSSNKACETKEDLKRLKEVWHRCQKVMKTDKDMRKYHFSSWLENFVYEKNKCNEEDITRKTK